MTKETHVAASDQSVVNVADTVNVHTSGPTRHYTAEEFAVFSISTAKDVLRHASIADGVIYLSGSTPARAAALLAELDLDEAIALVAGLDTSRFGLIVEHLPTGPTGTLLSSVPAAEESTISFGKFFQHILGAPKGSLRSYWSGDGRAGFRREHQKGNVYWSADSGPGMISNSIGEDLYGRPRLGYPIGPERQVALFGPDRSVLQRFEGPWPYDGDFVAMSGKPYGATVYQSKHGIFTTWCGIGLRYEKSRGAQGPFGFPTSNETEVVLGPRGDAGCYQTFEGGTFYWSAASDTVSLGGAFRALFKERSSDLGFPVSDQEAAPTSPFGTEGVLQRFRGFVDYPDSITEGWPKPAGAVCYSSQHGAWMTEAPIGTFYELHGGPAGVLGYPTEAEQYDPDEDQGTQAFEGGIVYFEGDHAIAVTGDIYSLWQRLSLGMPTSPERALDSGPDSIQFFERGAIAVIDGVATHWQTPDSA